MEYNRTSFYLTRLIRLKICALSFVINRRNVKVESRLFAQSNAVPWYYDHCDARYWQREKVILCINWFAGEVTGA